MLRTLTLSLLLALFVACSPSTPKVCTPGQSVACTGPGGCSGGQACKADGSGYEACVCGSGGGAGGGGGNGGGTGGGMDAGTGGGTGGAMGTRETWVVDRIELPLTGTQARDAGFDLDGDGTVDNVLGSFLAAMAEPSLQTDCDDSIDRATVVQLSETYTGASTSVAFETGVPDVAGCTNPSNPSTCRQHLNGSTTFTPAGPRDPALLGSGTPASFAAGPGAVTLTLPLFGPRPVTLSLVGARASFDRSGATLSGKVGGAIPSAEITLVVLPAMQRWANELLARDCPTASTCVSGSLGATLEQLYDANRDGTITVLELSNDPLITSLLAPDIDTTGGTTPNAISCGFAYHLVGAVF
jgi:hypothetical protein